MIETTTRFQELEQKVRAWYFKFENRSKTHPYFWWDIQWRFLDRALVQIGITHDQYEAFRQHMAAQDEADEVSDAAFALANR